MTLEELQYEIHKNACLKGFWGPTPNLAEKLALVHSEVSEALEELRLPKISRNKFGEELADIVIRVLDLAEYSGINLGTVIERKHRKNLKRPYKHGKTF